MVSVVLVYVIFLLVESGCEHANQFKRLKGSGHMNPSTIEAGVPGLDASAAVASGHAHPCCGERAAAG
jgi:hypothetical protein